MSTTKDQTEANSDGIPESESAPCPTPCYVASDEMTAPQARAGGAKCVW